MKTVAILTFQEANNYGAMLQCYALQKKINLLGAQCEVINYKCDYLSKPYGIRALKRKGIVRYILGNINACLRWPRRKKFENFRQEIPMSEKVLKNSIHLLNDRYDLFVTGSDQVWNYDLTDFDQTYFLDFVKDHEKKGSYAASIGFDKMENQDIRMEYKRLLADFSFISVREQSAKSMISDLCKKNVEVVLDPTLLIDAEEWEKIAVEPQIKYKYIFVYQLVPSGYLCQILKKLKKETGLKVVFAPFSLGNNCKGRWEFAAGPKEWIGLIKNAEYVVTDSFHGTVFSVLFKKKVYSCVNELGTRITSLLDALQLNELLFDKQREFVLLAHIDYSEMENNLIQLRTDSEQFLKQMIM
jgi:hypothetical protein